MTALFDTITLTPAGPDRVTISGVRGAPAPEKLKVAVNLFAGFRNTMSLVLTGRDAGAKADLALRMVAGVGLEEALGDPAAGRPAPSPRDLARASTLDVSALHVAFEDVAADDPATTAAAQGHLRITVKDLEQRKVGKPFTTAVVESALGAYPGMFPTAPPAEGTAYGIYWPTLIDRSEVEVQVTVDGDPVDLGVFGETQVALARGGRRWPVGSRRRGCRWRRAGLRVRRGHPAGRCRRGAVRRQGRERQRRRLDPRAGGRAECRSQRR